MKMDLNKQLSIEGVRKGTKEDEGKGMSGKRREGGKGNEREQNGRNEKAKAEQLEDRK